MSELINYISTKEGSEFYPTPKALVERMLEGIDLYTVGTILEPSAGKGDILRQVAIETSKHSHKIDVDCIEKDADLRQILKYNFSSDRKRTIRHRKYEIENKRKWDRELDRYTGITPEEEQEYDELYKEEQTFFDNGIKIIHDDFLTFRSFKTYNLILMNPPFSVGDKHLLKALELQKEGGKIVCLLNAETIRNPYTETRRELVRLLEQYDAEIEYIEEAFNDAERRANVDVALIRVDIPYQTSSESEIFNRMLKAENADEFDAECTDLEVMDFIKATINRFNAEVRAGIELIKIYTALAPHIKNGFKENNRPILRLVNSYERSYDDCVSVNSFLKDVREKYWQELLCNPKFVGRLTTKLQEEYRKKIDTLSGYDFSEFNIKTLLAEINAQVKSGIETEIEVMFDRLTEKHSYYPEFSKNRHYYNGWKTNQAYKIDKKVIIPCYGVFSSWSGRLDEYRAVEVLQDIERILNFFDGNMTANVDLHDTIRNYADNGITKNVPLKFFDVTFYKKGTAHITFRCPELIDRFNIYVARGKKWLPPSYGKKAYEEMSKEEQAVVDDFQGEKEYRKVLANRNFYLASPTESTSNLLLTG